jgi:hypothetical protein
LGIDGDELALIAGHGRLEGMALEELGGDDLLGGLHSCVCVSVPSGPRIYAESKRTAYIFEVMKPAQLV